MKWKILIFVFILNFISCKNNNFKFIDLDFNDIQKVKILKGYPDVEILISKSQNDSIIKNLRVLKEIQGPIKFGKTHKFVLFYKSKVNDTLYTNGTTFSYKNRFYSSKIDLLLKFKK